MEKISVYVNG